jgi:hypothetical protein
MIMYFDRGRVRATMVGMPGNSDIHARPGQRQSSGPTDSGIRCGDDGPGVVQSSNRVCPAWPVFHGRLLIGSISLAALPGPRLKVETMPRAGINTRVTPPARVIGAVLGQQPAQRAGRIQGGYYFLGGLWRLLHPRSFERVAGPKPDQFQTDVTAALFIAVGAALIAGALKGAPQGPTRILAVGAPVAVAAVNLKHRHQIRGLFRLEAALELAFAAAAAVSSPRPR